MYACVCLHHTGLVWQQTAWCCTTNAHLPTFWRCSQQVYLLMALKCAWRCIYTYMHIYTYICALVNMCSNFCIVLGCNRRVLLFFLLPFLLHNLHYLHTQLWPHTHTHAVLYTICISINCFVSAFVNLLRVRCLIFSISHTTVATTQRCLIICIICC